jgi:hypothetical protein
MTHEACLLKSGDVLIRWKIVLDFYSDRGRSVERGICNV